MHRHEIPATIYQAMKDLLNTQDLLQTKLTRAMLTELSETFFSNAGPTSWTV
ncbi:hypothetical protein ASPBRDRAFT_41705, partial [Aspergillus brasiliensis CBS 101740]